MSKLGEHPHIVRVLDAGEEDSIAFIVSEYVGGGDLAGALAESDGGRLEVERAVGDRRRRLPSARARARARDRPSRPQAGKRLARR